MNIFNIYYLFLKVLGGVSKIIFLNRYTAGKNFKLYFGGGIAGNREKIIIGNNVELYGWLISDGGTIIIGDNTKIHKNTIIRSMDRIEIGSFCDIANDVYIQDHNSMSLNYIERRSISGLIINKPIKIGNDVWIGRRSMILKGVSLPDKSIVAAGSVVTKGSERAALLAGNPAKIIRLLE